MKLIPDIPLSNNSPNPEQSNTIRHWGFFAALDITKAAEEGTLLMLDLDFGRACSLHCPGCFRRDNPTDENGLADLSYDQIVGVVDQARALGLRSIKLCGAGEPFEHPRLLEFASDLTKRGIGLAIFTKGHVLGEDEWSRRIFGLTGSALAQQFFNLQTSVMLSYPSFDDLLLSTSVGDHSGHYPRRVKHAAEVLANAGFNQTVPTRMAFVSAPLTRQTIGEAFEIYCFARERNILPVLAFHMVSGKQITPSFLRRFDPTDTQKIKFATLVYEYNLANGFSTREQLAREGISCMPGIHPCNQIAVGLYVTANGNVLRCPGDWNQPFGNIRQTPLKEIWDKTREWKLQGRFNCGCPYKDGITIPKKVYQILMERKT